MQTHKTQAVNAALDYTTPKLSREGWLSALYVHVTPAASGTAESISVILDSEHGEAYDAVIVTKDLNALTSYSLANIDAPLEAGDALRVTYANTDHKTVSVILSLF